MKKVFFLIATNIAVLLGLSVVFHVAVGFFGTRADGLLGGSIAGVQIGPLLIFSAVFGFGGAFVSLLLSKVIAKMSVGAHVINPAAPGCERDAWLVAAVEKLARQAGVRTPEVAIYSGAPNAFATGASKNKALVAVSDGLLSAMSRPQVEAVLGHELAHVANGDMVTLTLVQGVLNTFVLFFSRLVGILVDRQLGTKRGRGIGYFAAYYACQIVFGLLAGLVVAWVSRRREFGADRGSAQYLGSPALMISALRRLGGISGEPLPDNLSAFGISGGRKTSLFASHPPIEERIAALERG
jgi:Zn-dependent protease with chaperone function